MVGFQVFRRVASKVLVVALGGAASCFLFPTALAHQFHVGPRATARGNGSQLNPWTLQAALSHPKAVRPGDTIWIHGGTYRGAFESQLRGIEGRPIVVRQFPGERATIDGGNSNGQGIFTISGSWVWFWGFEVISSDPKRVSVDEGSYSRDVGRGSGILIDQDVKIVEGIKLINLVIHDTRQGLSIWENARGPEVYGCLLYNNGWVAPDRYHGHNMYLQNRVGIARFVDNIAHNAFSHDIHAYGSKAAALDSLYFEGNAVFSAGDRAFLLGGGTVAHYATIVNNYIYNGDFNIGHYPYGKGADHCFILKNYLVGGRIQFQNVSLTEVTGNLVFMMRLEGLSQSEYPDNSWLSSRPGKNTIVVRPNRYERGRGHVVVFNWIGQAAVGVDLSAILKVGERFVVRDAQDYFGVSVTKGRYTGRPVEISMNSSSISAPIGSSPFHAVHTGNDFGVFVVEIREGHDSN